MIFMLKYLCVILSAVAIFAADNVTETRTADPFSEIGDPSDISKGNEGASYTADLRPYNGVALDESDGPLLMRAIYNPVTDIIWPIDSDTNLLHLVTTDLVTTNWVSLGHITNQPPAIDAGKVVDRQIGYLQTNKVLILEYRNSTNKFLLHVIGRDEWPSQKRLQPVTPQVRRAK
jgi:hypothetical protein